jgi:hypothetical protein
MVICGRDALRPAADRFMAGWFHVKSPPDAADMQTKNTKNTAADTVKNFFFILPLSDASANQYYTQHIVGTFLTSTFNISSQDLASVKSYHSP